MMRTPSSTCRVSPEMTLPSRIFETRVTSRPADGATGFCTSRRSDVGDSGAGAGAGGGVGVVSGNVVGAGAGAGPGAGAGAGAGGRSGIERTSVFAEGFGLSSRYGPTFEGTLSPTDGTRSLVTEPG